MLDWVTYIGTLPRQRRVDDDDDGPSRLHPGHPGTTSFATPFGALFLRASSLVNAMLPRVKGTIVDEGQGEAQGRTNGYFHIDVLAYTLSHREGFA